MLRGLRIDGKTEEAIGYTYCPEQSPERRPELYRLATYEDVLTPGAQDFYTAKGVCWHRLRGRGASAGFVFDDDGVLITFNIGEIYVRLDDQEEV